MKLVGELEAIAGERVVIAIDVAMEWMYAAIASPSDTRDDEVEPPARGWGLAEAVMESGGPYGDALVKSGVEV